MNITPKDSPTIAKPPTAKTTPVQSARERAIAMLTQGPNPTEQKAPPVPTKAPQSTPVADPNNISAEELSAITQFKAKEEDGSTLPPTDALQTSPEANGSVIEDSKKAEAAPAKVEDPLSTQYALLARKEKALRAKENAQKTALQAREQELAAREAAIKAKEQEYSTNYIPKDRLTGENAWGTLSELGMTYDQLTQQALNPQTQDPVARQQLAKLQAEVAETRADAKKVAQAYEDSQKQSYTQAINQIKNDTKKLVATDEAYETIRETNSVDDVVELIERTFKEDGTLLTVAEAAEAVEEYLIEEALKISKIKKIQQRLNPQKQETTPAAPQSTSAQPPKQSQPKTLTNSMTTSRKLSAKERAILAFKGELKN